MYQAGAWDRERRVVAKVEWRQGPGAPVFPRVGFIVTNLSWQCKLVVRYDNQMDTAKQWIREGKNAVKWTNLLCHDFVDNHVRLSRYPSGFALAHNLGNFLRWLVLPPPMKTWTMTTLREKLIKIGARVVRHAKQVCHFPAGGGGGAASAYRVILERVWRFAVLSPRAAPI